MNITEGARKMQTAGRWIFLADIAFAVCMVAAQYFLTRYSEAALRPMTIVPLLFPVMLLGALLWLAGWIVEGFAKDAN